MDKSTMQRYSFQLLQYAPNLVSGEHFNIGVFLYDQAGRMVDARFTSDFKRLRCHPLADLQYLHALRNEFEEKRLLGEGFSAYAQELQRNLSTALQLSQQTAFWGRDAAAEIERLYQAYVASPRPIEEADAAVEPGTRRALRRRMDDAFRRHRLLGNGKRLERDVPVPYGVGRLRFTFDYAYQPNGMVKYIHGVALRNDVNEASKLCFVFERLRARHGEAALTAVLDDEIPADTQELLESSGVNAWKASQLDSLALSIRKELGL